MPLLALLAMAAAWGSTFFLIKDLLVRLPVADMLALRFGIGSLALLVLAGRRLRMSRRTLRSGLLLGLLYGVAQILQTAGLDHTRPASRASSPGSTSSRRRCWAPCCCAPASAGPPGPRPPGHGGLGVLSLHGFAIGYGELLTSRRPWSTPGTSSPWAGCPRPGRRCR